MLKQMIRATAIAATLLAAAGDALAFDPQNGDWGKTDPTDLRVMTWNVEDGICRTNLKTSNGNNWAAIARIIAAMKPDVLILQEVGDNSGNGTGGGVDSVANLTTTINLLINGGADPFRPGDTVLDYIKKFDPTLDYPYIFVSGITDGFNRNVILSRYPFTDLNGDGIATYSTMPTMSADAPFPSGNGGIRGFAHAEVDLPDNIYAGDLMIGNSHLKAGGSSSDLSQRLTASQNIAYYVYYMYAGAGTGSPNPNNKFRINPLPTTTLGPNDAVIWGGDLNEDEDRNSRRGPVAWMSEGETFGSTNGTDLDNSDSRPDTATEPFGGSRGTFSTVNKLDYLIHWDSTATARNQFVFRSNFVTGGNLPIELSGFARNASLASSTAADHSPVIVDYQLALAASNPPGGFDIVAPVDGSIGLEQGVTIDWTDASDADTYDIVVATDAALTNAVESATGLTSTQYTLANPLAFCSTYYVGVTAVNASGTTDANAQPIQFGIRGEFDLTGPALDGNPDGTVDAADLTLFLDLYVAQFGNPGTADLTGPALDGNPDGTVDAADLTYFLDGYVAQFGPCP